MTQTNQQEYAWFVAIAEKKKRKVKIWSIVPFAYAVFAIVVSAGIWIANNDFWNKSSFDRVDIENLTEDWASEHKYIKIENACFDENGFEKIFSIESENYYLLKSCDYNSTSKNRVIVVSSSKLASGKDPDKISDHFYIGRIKKGIDSEIKNNFMLDTEWDLKSKHVFTLYVNETPGEKQKEDTENITNFLLSIFIVGIISFVFWRDAKKNYNNWMSYFRMEYPLENEI